MHVQELKIPKDRVGVLIGKKGEVKKQIALRAHAKIEVDSETGEVLIKGDDSVGLLDAKNVILAIGRGFSPEIAMQLFNEENVMEYIDITDFTGKEKKKMARMRGRVIGESGKARRNIELLTETNISVYGKKISVIGLPEKTAIARLALEMLLSGSPHGNVYRMLEKKRRDFYKQRFANGDF